MDFFAFFRIPEERIFFSGYSLYGIFMLVRGFIADL